jgi:TP901 family phage tail tape measure protein
MVELAKGGLSVDQAMQAAKGTLQLAAAAQIDAAQAAEIQSNALNEFGLAADQAGHVADVLANTANAASGSIVDMANALKFVGPVAKGLNVSIDATSTAIGLLANNGIKGEQAGTSLRGILASLASPSKQAAKAMRELGIVAFDQKGKFVGLRTITDQLAKAKGRLSEQEFAAAASTAFGNEGFTAANALANEGAKAFDEMGTAVSRAGGAADVAGAKTKGLGGAIEGFKSQVETAGIGIFEVISGPLEAGVRKAADAVAAATPAVVSGIQHLVSAGKVFGPGIADALRDRAHVIGDAVREVLGPIAKTIPDILNAGINAAIGLWNDFTDVLKKGVDFAKPVAQGFASVAKSATEADGPLSAAGAALGLIGDGAKFAAGLLVPIGKIVGGIASAFADLPGPIQTAVIAMGLAAAFKGRLSSLGDTVTDRVTKPFKNFGEEVRLQQALLTGSTSIMSSQVGKVGLAFAALESRVPVIGKMADAFRNASETVSRSPIISAMQNLSTRVGQVRAEMAGSASELGKFGSAIVSAGTGIGTAAAAGVTGVGKLTAAVAGMGAAAGTAVKAGLTGLVGFLGGPWGIALAAAGVGLSILASKQQEAARRAADHRAAVSAVADALRNTGEVAARQKLAEDLVGEFKDAAQAAKGFGISLDDIVNSASLGVPVTSAFAGKLQELKAIIEKDPLSEQGQNALKVIGVIGELQSRWDDAKTKNELLDEAIRNGNVSMLDATGFGKDLAKAMGVLKDETSSVDDKVRALKEGLDILSGGEVDLEAAQASLHEDMSRLTEAFKTNGTEADIARRNADGFGKALINADGSVNTTLKNGKVLFDTLRKTGDTMAEVGQRTFEISQKMGDTLPASLDKARKASQGVRDEFVRQHEQMGLTAEQANALADRYGLLPDKVVTIISAPGMDKTQLELLTLRDLVNKVPADKPITVRSLSDEAKQKLLDLGFTVRTLPDGQVQIVARDQAARDRLNNLVADFQNRQIVLNVTARVSAILSQAAANVRGLFGHDGMVVNAFADGGVQRVAKPFTAGVPQVFPPNLLRFTGDRNRDDEFYIPDDEQPRSYALASEWARRHSMMLVRAFALGGIAPGSSSSPVQSASPNLNVQVFVGDREITDIVDVRIRETNRETRRRVLAGGGAQL